MKRIWNKPELMSPAGYWPQLKTAIEAGADAVYFGLKHFTARAKVGFGLAELPEVMQTLHARGAKGFVTFNTLVFDHELLEAEEALAAIAEAGADAIIVQDVGIAQLARRIAPGLEVHGSTQMSVTSAQGAELAKQCGCARVVLGRELSLPDIERIAQATDVDLEVFVHGALCVSYSGQCFSSEAWGGRSANRGQCAQACRLAYDLIVDGQQHDLGAYRYLLSPGDLYALHQVPELVRLGVACFKIEGRYKDSEYVALTTQAYRKAIDEACAGLALSITPEEELALEQVYSRGLGPYFLTGTNHQQVVHGRAPRHRGVQVGTVVRVLSDGVHVKYLHPLKCGDGLVFDAAAWRSPEEPEEGGSVYEVQAVSRDVVLLQFGHHAVDFTRIRAGDLVWRSFDPTLPRRLKRLTEATTPVYTRPVSFAVTARSGAPLQLAAQTANGHSAGVTGIVPLAPAQHRALDEAFLREHLGKLGGTPFYLEAVTLDSAEPLFVPVSEVNALRRQVVEQLMALQTSYETPPTYRVVADTLAQLQPSVALPTPAQVHVLVRTPEQLEAALAARPASITLDYLELYGLKPSVERVKAAGIRCRVASPRILKPTEHNILRFLSSLDCEILVRSGGLLYDLQRLPQEQCPVLTGDFSLNAANAITAQMYLDMGLTAITPTHDLNAQQIADLTHHLAADTLEVIVYQHLPVFHTEHCVFCRFLSTGTDYTNCGHPCETHRVALQDKAGRRHPVMADVGCRNTVFGAEAQVGTKHLPLWLAAGIRHFRLEFVHESARQVRQVVGAFQNVLAGEMPLEQLERTLKQLVPQGMTEGSLFVPLDYSRVPQLG
jgi:U32 family peptidase